MERQVQTALLSLHSRSWLNLENTKVKVSLERNGTVILAVHIKPVWSSRGTYFVRVFSLLKFGLIEATFHLPSQSVSGVTGFRKGFKFTCGGAVASGWNDPGLNPGRGHCTVFLGKILYSHSACLHPGV